MNPYVQSAWRVGGFVLLVVSLALLAAMAMGLLAAVIVTVLGAAVCFGNAVSSRKQQARYTELV